MWVIRVNGWWMRRKVEMNWRFLELEGKVGG